MAVILQRKIRKMAALTFKQINGLTDREIQILLREIDQKDLVIGLKAATAAFKNRVLGNMSKRVAVSISEEISFLGKMPAAEIAEVQERIVKQVQQLASQGWIVLPPGSKPKVPTPKAKAAANKAYVQQKKQLAIDVQKPLDDMTFEQINRLFRHLAEVARREGILALESFTEKMKDPFLQSAFRLAVDGTEPDLIMDLLKTWQKSLKYEFKCRHDKILEGIMAIQSGDNPAIVEHKLSVIY